MAKKVEVYDATGVKRTVREVDAREIIELGGSFEAPKPKPRQQVKKEVSEEVPVVE